MPKTIKKIKQKGRASIKKLRKAKYSLRKIGGTPTDNKSNKISSKNITGGSVLGVGGFGIVTANPAIAVDNGYESDTEYDPNNYVSKLFLDDNSNNTIQSFQNSLSILEKSVQQPTPIDNSAKYFKDLDGNVIAEYGKYLALPKRWIGKDSLGNYFSSYLGFTTGISDDSDSQFSKNEYWKKGANNYSYYKKLIKTNFWQAQYEKAKHDLLDEVSNENIKSIDDIIVMLVRFGNVVAGVSKLHSKDIVHLDIKPDNILVFETGKNIEYKLSDLDDITQLQDILGDQTKFPNKVLAGWAYMYYPTTSLLLCNLFKLSILEPYTQYCKWSNICPNSANSDNSTNSEINKTHINIIKQILDTAKTVITATCEASERQSYLGLLSIFSMHKIGFDILSKEPHELLELFCPKTSSINDTNSAMEYLDKRNTDVDNMLNEPQIKPAEKLNILLKYVDVYGIGISLLSIVFSAISYVLPHSTATPDKKRIQEIIRLVMAFLTKILTTEYFEQEIYSKNLSELYKSEITDKLTLIHLNGVN